MTTQPAASSDPTLDPNLRSWVASANDAGTDFPLQNLPLCTFRVPAKPGEAQRMDEHEMHALFAGKAGMAVGDCVVDVDMLMHAGAFEGSMLDGTEVDDDFMHDIHHALHAGGLRGVVDLLPVHRRYLREQVQKFLLDGQPEGGQKARRLREKAVMPMSAAVFDVPVTPPNYTDFYASIHHATNVGSMFRPDNPLLPNYKHVPIGYHGRASSVVASGLDVVRPRGQVNTDNAPAPSFGPSKRMDYELEMGVVIARGNQLAEPIDINSVADYIAGYVLVNDWSARDIQAWEYQPLGPFLAKNFATTVSPFMVTPDAMAPFMIAGPRRGADDPQPLEYLRARGDWGMDITLEVFIQSEQMRRNGLPAHRVSRGNFGDMYWTFAQMIAHHTVNGCNLLPGDLLASGTISGEAADSRGCMLELTWVGNGPDKKPLPRKPVELPGGEKRTFLEDGDEVIFRAYCERAGFRRIGFGECRGRVVAAGSPSPIRKFVEAFGLPMG